MVTVRHTGRNMWNTGERSGLGLEIKKSPEPCLSGCDHLRQGTKVAEMHKDSVEKGGERYGRNSEKHHCAKGGQRRRSPWIILRSKGQDVCQEPGESAQAWGALDLGKGPLWNQGRSRKTGSLEPKSSVTERERSVDDGSWWCPFSSEITPRWTAVTNRHQAHIRHFSPSALQGQDTHSFSIQFPQHHPQQKCAGCRAPASLEAQPAISPPGFPLWEALTLLPLSSLQKSS